MIGIKYLSKNNKGYSVDDIKGNNYKKNNIFYFKGTKNKI